MKRCSWVKEENPIYVAYHDEEWGRPLHDDQALFELLCLETYQAGLSWETVLKKRQSFREAFHYYDWTQVAMMTDNAIESLLTQDSLIRNRRKLFATRDNAKAFLKVIEIFGSFSTYLWGFVQDRAVDEKVEDYTKYPVSSSLSEELTKDLKSRGFKFVGPVSMQSFIQAAGLLNCHELTCEWHDQMS